MEAIMRVLVIEDDKLILRVMIRQLQSHGFETVAAETLQEARSAFQSNPDFFAILFDGSLDKAGTTTIELIAEIKQMFQGHMIAMSNNDRMRPKQMAAGCTHEVEDKSHAPQLVVNLAQG